MYNSLMIGTSNGWSKYNSLIIEASDGWSTYNSLLIEPWEPNNSKKETLNRIWLLKHGLGTMQQF